MWNVYINIEYYTQYINITIRYHSKFEDGTFFFYVLKISFPKATFDEKYSNIVIFFIIIICLIIYFTIITDMTN